jgi:hypothetical protein
MKVSNFAGSEPSKTSGVRGLIADLVFGSADHVESSLDKSLRDWWRELSGDESGVGGDDGE